MESLISAHNPSSVANTHYITRLKRAGESIIREQGLRLPSQRKAILFLGDVALNWILLLWLVAVLPLPQFIVVHWLLTVRVLNAMAQITHGCGHYAFLSGRSSNYRLGTIFSSFMGYRFEDHNRVHDDHHHFLNTPKDGDLPFGEPTQSRRAFLVGLASDLCGYQAWSRLLQYFSSGKRNERASISRGPFVHNLWLILLAQLLLWSAFYICHGPWAYFFVYALPICTFYPAQARVRSLAEHHLQESDREVSSSLWMSRDTEPSFLERQFIGPFYQNYHLEHHLFPDVPGYNLRDLHRHLEKQVGFEQRYLNPSYIGFMWRFLFPRESDTLTR